MWLCFPLKFRNEDGSMNFEDKYSHVTTGESFVKIYSERSYLPGSFLWVTHWHEQERDINNWHTVSTRKGSESKRKKQINNNNNNVANAIIETQIHPNVPGIGFYPIPGNDGSWPSLWVSPYLKFDLSAAGPFLHLAAAGEADFCMQTRRPVVFHLAPVVWSSAACCFCRVSVLLSLELLFPHDAAHPIVYCLP